jgi:4-hydroxy-L-threonine phosphate dehydrogenase PdxA
MLRKPILIVPGQINSIFFEIFFKSLNKKKIVSPIILICNVDNFKLNARKNNYKQKINIIKSNINKIKFKKNSLNIININLKKNKKINNQVKYHQNYMIECFETAFKILRLKITYKFLNGPINKKKI